MTPPAHHKEVAIFLREKINGDVKVTAYRDNNDSNPIPIGEFGSGNNKFYSTIGAFDMHLRIPAGTFEFASRGKLEWLPNVIASSIYWLNERSLINFPLVCEDVVKNNTKSTYSHMAYIPSTFKLYISTGQEVQWLLGIPITDSEISISTNEILKRAKLIYPEWLFHENA